LKDQIIKKVSALAVAPAGVSEILPLLDKARAAGIPVVIFDTDVDWNSKLTFVGSDNREAGRLAATHIVKVLSGKGKVAVIRAYWASARTMTASPVSGKASPAPREITCITVQPATANAGWV
jgi:ribose transport system substrate-binding protein